MDLPSPEGRTLEVSGPVILILSLSLQEAGALRNRSKVEGRVAGVVRDVVDAELQFARFFVRCRNQILVLRIVEEILDYLKCQYVDRLVLMILQLLDLIQAAALLFVGPKKSGMLVWWFEFLFG